LLADNLLNIEQQPSLDISTVLAPYKMHFHAEQEWMYGCIETYGKLSCNETAIYAGILALISAISGDAYYVDECNGQEPPLNLYVHIIGEPGGHLDKKNESAAPESKFLTQAYDGIHNESGGTGTTQHVIADGKLAIFGASTGQRYAFNMRNFTQNIENDGVLIRMSYLVMPYGGAKSISNRIPISMPNVLHIGAVILLLIKSVYPIQLRFEKLQSDFDNEPPRTFFLEKSNENLQKVSYKQQN
ncbi:unnamed protein product, partial [Rotaria socialis]